MYGDNAIRESTARKWLVSRFKEDRFDASDTPRSRRHSEFDEDRLNTLIHNDTRQCTREVENVMNCDHSTIVRHLHSNGKVKKSGVWIAHNLSQNSKNQRVAICASLIARHGLAREQHRPFLSCNGSASIRKRKEWLSPKKRRICRKCSNFSTWYSIFKRPLLQSQSSTDKTSIYNLEKTFEIQIKNDNI